MSDSVNGMQAAGLQLLGHMRWANEQLLLQLEQLPNEAIEFHSNFDDWTVARIAHHLAGVSARLAARAKSSPMPIDNEVPTSPAEFATLRISCAASDEELIALAQLPDELCTFDLFGTTQTQHRSIIIAQAVHHADEHRAQIAGILASNGHDVINLDKLSLWYYNKVLS